jgi:hypothetical protein
MRLLPGSEALQSNKQNQNREKLTNIHNNHINITINYMKKLLLTSAATLLTVAAFAQGTVAFSNGAFNRVSTGQSGSAASTWTSLATTANLYNFGLFYGTGATAPATLTFLSSTLGVNSTTSAGVIQNAAGANITALAIPGSTVGQTDMWIEIKGWTASFGTDWATAQGASASGNAYFGATTPINVGPLGPTTGPGIAFWTTASGTNPQLHAGGFAMFTTTTIPEPGTMALAGLGVATLMIFRRRK